MSSGKRVTTTCSVFHSCPSDPPNFTWSHKGTLSSQSLQQTNGQWKITSTLSFTPSRTDHKKTLTCTAGFLGGRKSSSMKNLEVKCKRKIIYRIYAMVAERGHRASKLRQHTQMQKTLAYTENSCINTNNMKCIKKYLAVEENAWKHREHKQVVYSLKHMQHFALIIYICHIFGQGMQKNKKGAAKSDNKTDVFTT